MEQDGRVGKPTGLSQAEPQEGLGPPGFDPSRDDDSAMTVILDWYKWLPAGARKSLSFYHLHTLSKRLRGSGTVKGAS